MDAAHFRRCRSRWAVPTSSYPVFRFTPAGSEGRCPRFFASLGICFLMTNYASLSAGIMPWGCHRCLIRDAFLNPLYYPSTPNGAPPRPGGRCLPSSCHHQDGRHTPLPRWLRREASAPGAMCVWGRAAARQWARSSGRSQWEASAGRSQWEDSAGWTPGAAAVVLRSCHVGLRRVGRRLRPGAQGLQEIVGRADG